MDSSYINISCYHHHHHHFICHE